MSADESWWVLMSAIADERSSAVLLMSAIAHERWWALMSAHERSWVIWTFLQKSIAHETERGPLMKTLMSAHDERWWAIFISADERWWAIFISADERWWAPMALMNDFMQSYSYSRSWNRSWALMSDLNFFAKKVSLMKRGPLMWNAHERSWWAIFMSDDERSLAILCNRTIAHERSWALMSWLFLFDTFAQISIKLYKQNKFSKSLSESHNI